MLRKVRVRCDRLVIQAANILISDAELTRVDVDQDGASVTIEDSLIDGGQYAAAAVGYRNLTLRRVDIRGGQTSVQCTNCTIEDSWLHDQMKPVGDQHLGGYLSNGGSKVVISGNTITCDPPDNQAGGGCTGGLQLFGDFAPLTDYAIIGNYFEATTGGFCASFGYNPGKRFGANPLRIQVRDNIFERGPTRQCGVYGAVTSFPELDKTSSWSNNVYSDGTPIAPN